jgi:hypothetical protein
MAVAIDALQVANEFLHVIDVVVQVELTVRHRHQARILPVGDVDLVVLEHGAHGVAQQRGVVARKRCHDQHGRLALEPGQRGGIIRETLEAAQLAERLVDFDTFVNGHVDPIHIDGADAELGFLVVLAQTVHQGVAGGDALGHGGLAEQAQRVAVELGGSLGQVRKRFHE